MYHFPIVEMSGRSTNFYAYVQNSPLNIKDPSGKLAPLAVLIVPLLIRSGIGAAESAAFEVAFSLATDGEFPSWKGKNCTVALV